MGCNYYKMFPQFRKHLKKKGLIKDISQEDFQCLMGEYFGFSPETARKWMGCFEKAKYIRFRQHIDEMSGVGCGWSVDFV